MSTSPQFLLLIVVAISAIHMVAPDHWIPITVAAYRNKFTYARTYLFASIIGLAHGVSSAVLSLLIVELGSILFPGYYVNLFAVVLLLAVAFYVIANAAIESKSGDKAESVSVLVSVIPDPALVPFIVIAQGFGAAYTIGLLGAFVVAAIVTVVLVVYLATKGLSAALSRINGQYVDYIVGLALTAVAAFIYFYG